MSSEPSDEALAREILAENEDISPLLEDVVDQVRLLRGCGLPDSKIRETVPGTYRLRETAVENGAMEGPAADEIRVISLPRRYQRADWS